MVASLSITSSSRLPNVRRPVSDLSDRQRLARAKFDKYRDAPVDEDHFVNNDTKKHREWLMGIWNKFFLENDVNPDLI
ncbi:hypothetical protein CC80DRAFT_549302 [Byssothecium circinans]|uniref:Uncharacterized protein n=1 Tax=Byssothecium circinans TaxID=147558 RepID=A0A6A5TSJ4_9PLEO|nr:hypothetical protein CC80DRAFT_549302 [Byssothecium circinans]